VFRRHLSELQEHVEILVILELGGLPWRADAVELLIWRVERRIGQDGLVVEEEADRVEAILRQEPHVPRNLVLVQPERRPRAFTAFAAKPAQVPPGAHAVKEWRERETAGSGSA
jgi:hypothetical protein